jgi:hypothetical protein
VADVEALDLPRLVADFSDCVLVDEDWRKSEEADEEF